MSRKNISLTDPIEERALAIISKRGFTGLSDMIAVLVREEYERKVASGEIREPATEYKTSSGHGSPAGAEEILGAAVGRARGATTARQPPAKPIKYTTGRRSKKQPHT